MAGCKAARRETPHHQHAARPTWTRGEVQQSQGAAPASTLVSTIAWWPHAWRQPVDAHACHAACVRASRACSKQRHQWRTAEAAQNEILEVSFQVLAAPGFRGMFHNGLRYNIQGSLQPEAGSML